MSQFGQVINSHSSTHQSFSLSTTMMWTSNSSNWAWMVEMKSGAAATSWSWAGPMIPAREMTNRKSILPLQPGGPGSKSGGVPMSGNRASVVDVPALSELLPDELPDELDEPSLVELDPPELDSSGRVVTPGVVKLVEVAPGPLQATARTATRERRTEPRRLSVARSRSRAKPGLGLLPWSVADVIEVHDHAAALPEDDQVEPPAARLLVDGREQEFSKPAILVEQTV
jgi:hypothetical protein